MQRRPAQPLSDHARHTGGVLRAFCRLGSSALNGPLITNQKAAAFGISGTLASGIFRSAAAASLALASLLAMSGSAALAQNGGAASAGGGPQGGQYPGGQYPGGQGPGGPYRPPMYGPGGPSNRMQGGPQFGPPGGQQGGAPSPAEFTAYASAISTSPPDAQAAALRSFLRNYPQSSLAPQARKWLGLADQNQQKPSAAIPAAAVPGSVQPLQQAAPPPAVEAPRRAVIDLSPHTLTIRADNSSLSQILHDLSTSGGMEVQGLSRDQRIYGSFGPGEPQDVIASLIDGMGYNILMVGTTSRGVPRQLILSPRPTGNDAGAAGSQMQPSQPDGDEEVIQDDQNTQPEQNQGRPFIPPPSNGPGPGPNGRSTQEMLDELRRMHQQTPDQPQPNPQQ